MIPVLAEIPDFVLSKVPAFDPIALDVCAIEAELETLPHLESDHRHDAPDTERTFKDARQVKTAAEAIERLPGPREAIHLAISGRFALFDVVPAVLALAGGATIETLTIATLGFSKANIIAMGELIDTGKIGRVTLLCSHYFAGTSKPIYDFAVEELAKRSQKFISLRSHAKLLAMKLTDGRTVTVEASANLRSCKNIEQLTVIGDPGLYAFHVGWIEELCHART